MSGSSRGWVVIRMLNEWEKRNRERKTEREKDIQVSHNPRFFRFFYLFHLVYFDTHTYLLTCGFKW